MKECCEKIVKIGFNRNPRKIFDEVEALSAEMIRQGWYLRETCIEDGLGFVHLFFEKKIDNKKADTYGKGEVV